jgi:LysM repeat protein
MVGAGVAALGIGAVAMATGMLDGPIEPRTAAVTMQPIASPTPRPTPTASPSPSLAPSPTAVMTPVPTPAPTEVPTIAPTAPPAPPPTQQTYTVQQGDTLAAIAQRFGTTVARLQAANGIEDPNEIFIGQVLVIA